MPYLITYLYPSPVPPPVGTVWNQGTALVEMLEHGVPILQFVNPNTAPTHAKGHIDLHATPTDNLYNMQNWMPQLYILELGNTPAAAPANALAAAVLIQAVSNYQGLYFDGEFYYEIRFTNPNNQNTRYLPVVKVQHLI